jgi:hypothetical protein
METEVGGVALSDSIVVSYEQAHASLRDDGYLQRKPAAFAIVQKLSVWLLALPRRHVHQRSSL